MKLYKTSYKIKSTFNRYTELGQPNVVIDVDIML